MKFFLVLAYLGIFLFNSTALAADNSKLSQNLISSDWEGLYIFEENGGVTAGGSPITIFHELNIYQSDDGLRANLKSNGYQTQFDLNCTVKITQKRLDLFFESYGDDNLFEIFKPGDLLLSLEYKFIGGKEKLLTTWQKFKPIVPGNEKSGRVYFVKQSDKLSFDYRGFSLSAF